jgi:hypothetical protein
MRGFTDAFLLHNTALKAPGSIGGIHVACLCSIGIE